MDPGVDLMADATPPLPLQARAVEGHLMVELLPSVQVGVAVLRNREKFWVVPEESERTTMVIGLLGSVTPGLSAAIAELFQVVILPWKMLAMTGADSCSGLLRLDRLYDSVIGPIMTGKYSTVLPLKFAVSAAGIGESEPAKLVTPEARSVRPLPEPPEP